MTASLRPRPGFNWTQVSWGGPDEVPTDTCSYCDAPLGSVDEPDYEIPLMIGNGEGWCAQFCVECQRTWWGVE
jgi:hypothetical protein